MIKATLTDLLDCMRKHQYKAEIEVDSQQVFTHLKISSQEYLLFLRFFENSQLLQLLVFIPTELSENTTPDTARLLHLLNKEIDMPGFGMSEMEKIIFYRLMIPIRQKQIDEDLFLNYLKAAESVCELFTLSIQTVANGHATLNEILEKVKQAELKKTTP